MEALMSAREVYTGITIDEEVMHGQPVVAGTRIPAALVAGQVQGGVTLDELWSEYHLSSV
jgi:uncharacterized protein (DUF433 family)